jgi:hypothetical protein
MAHAHTAAGVCGTFDSLLAVRSKSMTQRRTAP